MPPRSHTAAARNARTSRSQEQRARPRHVTQRLPMSKIGWDRKFRFVMLAVVGLVVVVGLKAGIALMSARAQAAQESSLVSSLQRQHNHLVAVERSLHQKATVMRLGRQLGMVGAGERPFVVVAAGN